MSIDPEVTMTLDEAVQEVLGLLTGLDLNYLPELDRYYAVTRQLNRALRSNSLEHEWSFYSATLDLGTGGTGTREVEIPSTARGRVIGDDSVRLVDNDGITCRWAYVLPRDALHKYQARRGLWCAYTRTTIQFSRPLTDGEGELSIVVPVMREPVMFRLPARPEDDADPVIEVPDEIREQELDFQYPDVVILRAAFYYAQSDPIMQPRVQTIEAQYKDLMYQVIERDDRITDSPYLNEFFVPVVNGIDDFGGYAHFHPHADERR